MKCISCEIEINPQWKHAIDMNVCPFCGKHIMEEHLKNLFASLRETMDALQAYPTQLDDWMLSNHNYIKTDAPEIGKYMPREMLKEIKKVQDEEDFQRRKENQKFTVKVKTEAGEEEVLAEKIQSEEKTNSFFKRAEVIKSTSSQQSAPQAGGSQTFQSPAEKTEHLKKLAQQIKREGSQGLTTGGMAMSLPAEMLENADPEAVAEFQQLLEGGEVSSSIDSELDDDLPGGEYILQANLAAAQSKQGGASGEYNPKDAAALQRMQSKISQSRKNISTGAKGSFSRS